MKPSPKPQAAQVFFSNITKNITEHEIFFNKLPDTDGNHKNLAWIFRYLLIETVSHFVIVGKAVFKVFHLVYGLRVSSTLLLQPVSELLVRLWMCGNVKYGGGWWSLCWGRRKDVGILAPRCQDTHFKTYIHIWNQSLIGFCIISKVACKGSRQYGDSLVFF